MARDRGKERTNIQGNTKDSERRGERGSVAVLLALAFTVLTGFAALVTDVGILYAKHAHLQNAVDAAALAGVQELPGDPAQAQAVAEEYAHKNGVQAIDVTFSAYNTQIRVRAEENVPAYLAVIWGVQSTAIGAEAKAMMVSPTSLTGIVPLSIEEQSLEYGVEYQLKEGGGEGDHGWYGPVQLSGQGAQNYETDLKYGYQGVISVGQVLDVEHGNISGKTAEAMAYRMDEDEREPRNTFEDHDPDAPEIVYVPVVKILSYQGNSVHELEVVGFAAFFLEGVEGMGHESIITGRFIKTIVTQGRASGSIASFKEAEDRALTEETGFGLYTPKLLLN
ncbi:MAG: pilus assembly protein [Desulfitobacteriaceae bacterium]|nr:pilus assembly protein [Desulfitobacteriaceae bacterium]MDI6879372.1 pilus assembly protein [Desulfitobacteriaceae bacterium]MDI6913995.1 pilus assembly protein [Desulfitobacteriaceae bacterium]